MKKLFMVGNTHIDPVWLWKRAEGMQEVKSSFASALDRMEEFPDFKFTHSSIGYLEWLQINCPHIFERIRQREQEGRWEVAGGMWVEPDSDIPCGESVIRHFLYGRLFTDKYFTRTPDTVYNVDSFGHGANLPCIYQGCGMKHYVINRPCRKDLNVPPVFAWKAKDQSRIIVERAGGEYMAWTKPAIQVNMDESLEEMDRYGQDSMAVFYGVGNHGGGPTVDNIRSIYELKQEHPELSMELSSIRDFFSQVDEEKLPEVEGELGRVFFGCYSSDNEIKRLNRQAEWTLLKAEAVCSMARDFAGDSYVYPYEKLEAAWKEVLFNQFHDVLAGTSIEPSRNEAADEFRFSLAQARHLINDGIQAIANSLDTRGEGFPLLLINSTGHPYQGMVFADIYVPRAQKKPLRIRDTEGREAYFAESGYRFFTPESRKGILLQCEIPAYGYAMYRVMCEGSENPTPESTLKAEENRITNGILELQISSETGAPQSIRRNGREVLQEPASIKVFYDDRGAWGYPRLEGEAEGAFICESMEVLEQNFLRVILRCYLRYEASELVLDYILEKDCDQLKVNGWIHNHQRHAQIALSVKSVCPAPVCRNETCFLVEEKAVNDGSEYYQHRFADIAGPAGDGITVFNNSSYGMRLMGNEYLCILSRSAMFARGGNGPEERSIKNRFMDQGVWEFQLGMLIHDKPVKNSRLFQIADQMHMPVEYLGDSNHKGKHFLRKDSSLTLEGKGVCSSAMKQKEGCADSRILRFFETEGAETRALIHFRNSAGAPAAVTLKPYEVKTIEWTDGKATLVDMVEKPLELTESAGQILKSAPGEEAQEVKA